MENLSQIQQFYYGKNVLITGATGFLGKLLVEKLLRCCPGIGKLYLLVREKKGKDLHTRFNEILNDPLFFPLVKKDPKFRQKIVLIAGDCLRANLGLSTSDRQIIIEQVNVIFHLAATVKFTEQLRLAFNLNVQATSDLLLLAKNMRSLSVFMHISTAFAYPYLPFVAEEFYPVEMERSQLQDILRNKTDAEIEKILLKILAPWPNTYSFSKALAEKEMLTNRGDIPVGVFRPAVVTSTANEPIKSWIGNFFGPATVVVYSGMGILHTLHCDENAVAELVPGDYVVNCLIAAAFDVHRAYQRCPAPSKPLIYNYVSSIENKITWGEFKAHYMADLNYYPLSKAVGYKFLMFNKFSVIYVICNLFFHKVPELVTEILETLGLQTPGLGKSYKRIQKFSSSVEYFITKTNKYCNKRTRILWEECSDLDKQLFPFSMNQIKWSEYFKGYTLGIKRYLLKENDEEILQAREKLKSKL